MEDAFLPRHDGVQRAFHRVMAVLILVALLIGLYCSFQAPGTPVRRWLLEWHKSLGMTALVLVGLRIAYRLTIHMPPYAERMGCLTQAVAHGAHLLLYGLMLFMPLTGYCSMSLILRGTEKRKCQHHECRKIKDMRHYLFSGAGGYSLPWFWVFQWPRR